jgi:arylsulfatase A-like enzyme
MMRYPAMSHPLSALPILVALSAPLDGGGEPVPSRPNIVFILADDLGWRDTGVYGSPFHETPSIDRLARRGMMLLDAYAANPLCSPTRASIMTGLYPARLGITAPICHVAEERLAASIVNSAPPHLKALQAVSATRLGRDRITLAEVLKGAGYVTGHFGKWHLGPAPYGPRDQGFDVDVPGWHGPGPAGSYIAPWKFPERLGFQGKPGEHVEDRLSEEAVRFIRENRDRPFFLNYWAFSVHAPFGAKGDLIEAYRAKVPSGSPQRCPLYAAMVKSLDDAVGRILDALDSLGIADRTIVIFTSDNGGNIHERVEGVPPTSNAPLRGGKASLYEGGTRVPCIVAWPGKTAPGGRTSALLSSVDLFPTVLEMAGVARPPDLKLDGVSQVPALLGRGAAREAAFCHFPHYTPATGALPATWVRKGDWKLIRFHHDGEGQEDRFELYEVAKDPGEERNLAADNPDRVKDLAALIEGHLRDTGTVIPARNPRFAPVAPASADTGVKRPNVLFIAIDDLRDWTGYLGSRQAKTPRLDRLASQGVYFTRSYCASPVCNPSRTALLTGLRPGSTGVYGNAADWRSIVPDAVTLPQHFKRSGYHVVGAGKIYHGSFPRVSDWDEFFPRAPRDGAPRKEADAPVNPDAPAPGGGVGGIGFRALDCEDSDMPDYWTVEYALRQLAGRHEKPFFIACGLVKPHLPWNVPRKYFDLFPLDRIELPPVKEDDLDDVPPAGVRMANPGGDHAAILLSGRWKEAVQAYLAAIAFTDAMVGRLLDGLARSPHADSTIVCLWSDHGWHLGEKRHWRKFTLWEESARAPFIMVVPGLTRPAACHRTIDFMCIYPTLCDLCGIPVPPHVQGESIRKLLADPASPWDRPAVTTYLRGNHTVRDERWRYIRYADGGEELYDHDRDPQEWTNVAGREECAANREALKKWLPGENRPPPAKGEKTKAPARRKKAAARS